MMELIQNMYENYVKRACGYEFQVQSQFYMLMYLMITQYRINEVSEDMVKSHRKLNRLSSITSYIRDNYQKELSLEYIAEIFGYSPTYLSKMFQKYAKINYKAYLQSVRVEYAYQELVKTDKTISEIAENMDFRIKRHLQKSFRRNMECCRVNIASICCNQSNIIV